MEIFSFLAEHIEMVYIVILSIFVGVHQQSWENGNENGYFNRGK